MPDQLANVIAEALGIKPGQWQEVDYEDCGQLAQAVREHLLSDAAVERVTDAMDRRLPGDTRYRTGDIARAALTAAIGGGDTE